MHIDFYLACEQCRRYINLADGITIRTDADGNATPILDFISKHQHCDKGVIAFDDNSDHAFMRWEREDGKPTVNQQHEIDRQAWLARQGGPDNLTAELHGLTPATQEEKRAIWDASKGDA